jgi:hypothetical protein
VQQKPHDVQGTSVRPSDLLGRFGFFEFEDRDFVCLLAVFEVWPALVFFRLSPRGLWLLLDFDRFSETFTVRSFEVVIEANHLFIQKWRICVVNTTMRIGQLCTVFQKLLQLFSISALSANDRLVRFPEAACTDGVEVALIALQRRRFEIFSSCCRRPWRLT